jgi:hypothetical protein
MCEKTFKGREICLCLDMEEASTVGGGMQFLRFGAKITCMWKPCDVWGGFNTKKAACKKTTVIIDDDALEQYVNQRLTQLTDQYTFSLMFANWMTWFILVLLLLIQQDSFCKVWNVLL